MVSEPLLPLYIGDSRMSEVENREIWAATLDNKRNFAIFNDFFCRIKTK